MRVYEVFRGPERHAVLVVQEDGSKDWTFDPTWHDFYLPREVQQVLEEAVEQDPEEPTLFCEPFTLHQREGCP